MKSLIEGIIMPNLGRERERGQASKVVIEPANLLLGVRCSIGNTRMLKDGAVKSFVKN